MNNYGYFKANKYGIFISEIFRVMARNRRHDSKRLKITLMKRDYCRQMLSNIYHQALTWNISKNKP